MNFSDYFTLVGIAVSFITALAALLTILEMKRQRKAAFYEEVLLARQPYTLVMKGAKSNPIFKMIPLNSDARKLSYAEVTQHTEEPDELYLYNVGNRPVLDLYITWTIDTSSIIKSLQAMDVSGAMSLSHDALWDRGVLMISNLDEPIYIDDEALRYKTGVILPYDSPESFTSVKLPYFYYECIKILLYFICIANENDVDFTKLGPLPIIGCEINYSTIDGKNRLDKYILQIDIEMFGFGRHRYNPLEWNIISKGCFKPIKIK